MMRPAPPVMSGAAHTAWAAALQPGAALDLSFDGTTPHTPSPHLPSPPLTSPHLTTPHRPPTHHDSGGFWDVELVRADGTAQTSGPPVYSVRALQFDAEHSVGAEHLRPAHVWDAARREWTSRPPPGVHMPATPKAKKRPRTEAGAPSEGHGPPREKASHFALGTRRKGKDGRLWEVRRTSPTLPPGETSEDTSRPHLVHRSGTLAARTHLPPRAPPGASPAPHTRTGVAPPTPGGHWSRCQRHLGALRARSSAVAGAGFSAPWHRRRRRRADERRRRQRPSRYYYYGPRAGTRHRCCRIRASTRPCSRPCSRSCSRPWRSSARSGTRRRCARARCRRSWGGCCTTCSAGGCSLATARCCGRRPERDAGARRRRSTRL